MTTTILTSEKNKGSRNHECFIATSQLIYQVTVNGEDGDTDTFEVMADDYASACAQAENRAYERMIDISYIEVECMG